jgi:DNA-binding Xre family transcriptional regulator
MDELAIKTLEKQNDLLAKRVESDSALIKGLESYNLRLVKDVEVERMRVNRLNNICIAIGVVAVAGLAMAVRLSLQ